MEPHALTACSAPCADAPPVCEARLTCTRCTLARLAPWLARAAAGPAFALPDESSEDLVQSVLTSCLARVARAERAGALPEWCADEDRLRAYLAGALTRHHARRWRDHRHAVGLPPDLCVHNSEPHDACPRLRTLEEGERRLLEAGREERRELAAALRIPRPTLEKRRTRLRQRMRVRCRSCARRRSGACAWLGTVA